MNTFVDIAFKSNVFFILGVSSIVVSVRDMQENFTQFSNLSVIYR